MNNSMNSRRPFSKALKVRRGSALILVLIMTLSLAGLAMSAIYLSSSAGLLSRYYDRERNYRYAAEAAIALGKSRLQVGDTTLKLPDDSAKVLLTAASLTDANGITIPRVLVNLYGGYTGIRQRRHAHGAPARPDRGELLEVRDVHEHVLGGSRVRPG